MNYYTFIDDFADAYTTPPVTGSSPYVNKITSSGTFSQASPTLANGVAVLSGATTTTKSGIQIQGDHESVFLTVGSTTEFLVRYQTATPTTIECFFGLGNQYGATGTIQTTTQSTPLLSNLDTTHYTDFIGLYHVYNAAALYGVTNVTSGTPTIQSGCGTIVASTWTNLGIVITNIKASGTGDILFYQDNVLLQTLSQVPIPANTKGLAPIISMLSATASGTITASFDYLIVSNSR